MLSCPNCAAAVAAEHVFCAFCGTRLRAASGPLPSSTPTRIDVTVAAPLPDTRKLTLPAGLDEGEPGLSDLAALSGAGDADGLTLPPGSAPPTMRADDAQTFAGGVNGGANGEVDLTYAAPLPHPDGATMMPGGDAPTFAGGAALDDRTYLPPPKPASRRQSGGRTRVVSVVPSDHLQPGAEFGSRYRITRMLGVGGMGAVYQAWDAELNVAVAIKTIRPGVGTDGSAALDAERRFKRELLLARQVTHPNVVRIYDLGEIDDTKYITMSYVEGQDLASILATEGKLPVARALDIMRQVVSGMRAAHVVGIVHRDLKPANIMIEGDTALIMDFGIARSVTAPAEREGAAPVATFSGSSRDTVQSALTVAGSVMGTLDYMAPEQATAQPVDQRADVYALGLIFRDIILGRAARPRTGNAFADFKERVAAPMPAPRTIDTEIPEAIDALIEKCLQPDPAARFQSSDELGAALDRLDRFGKPIPIVRRLTRPAMAAAAGLVLLLLGGAIYGTRWLTAPPVEHAPVTVLIADFKNTTNDPTFDHTVGQALRRGLESASFITAFDRTRVRATFAMQAPEVFDEVAARQLAIKQGLGVVLAGSIALRGSEYQITVQATEPMTGNVITSVSRRAADRDQVLAAVTRLVTGLRNALGDDTSDSAQQLAMKTISTTSLDVASQYAAAVNAQSRGNAEEALASFAKAVALDPKFGLGYQGLAVMSRNLGRLQDAEKYAGEALKYLDNMTERERYATRGYYYIRTGDYKQCVTEYAELIARYPADVPAHNQRASCLARLRDMRAAVNEMKQVVAILPNQPVYRSNLAVLLNYSGEFTAAEQEIRTIKEPSARALGALALSQQGQGLVGEATKTYQTISTMDAFGASYGRAGLADLAVYEGRFAEAAKLFEQGAAADLAAKRPDAAAMKFAALASTHLAAGQSKRAAAAAEKALTHSTSAPIRFLTARVFAETGDVARARAMAAAFTSQVGAEQQAYGKIIEGGLALQAGDPRLAAKLLTEANEAHDTWLGHYDLGRALLAARAYPQADSEFDRCIQRRGEALTVVDEDPTYGQFPAVYYYLGRVREELKTASFADAYREYLKIRGQSSEDPLVPEIRKRVGG